MEQDVTEKLQDGMGNFLNYLTSFLQNAETFARGEVPEVINQFLMWKMVSSTLSIVVASCLLIILYKTFLFMGKKKEQCEKDKKDNMWWEYYEYSSVSPGVVGVFFCIGATILAGVSVIAIVCDVFTIAKLYFAPKVYLIEYVIEIAKGVKK